jgi:hypothetical protein
MIIFVFCDSTHMHTSIHMYAHEVHTLFVSHVHGGHHVRVTCSRWSSCSCHVFTAVIMFVSRVHGGHHVWLLRQNTCIQMHISLHVYMMHVDDSTCTHQCQNHTPFRFFAIIRIHTSMYIYTHVYVVIETLRTHTYA